jgi:hypothetical protein
MRPHVLVSLVIVVLACGSAVACTKQAPDAMPPHAEAAASASQHEKPAPAPAAEAGVTATLSSDAGPRDDRDAGALEQPAIKVKVVTIGMHVGGGPYDEPTKEPMKRSVEPRFPDLARCWRHVAKPVPTEVGVDLVIEAAGGRAKVSNPRTTATGEGFVPCVVAFFESVDFEKPRNGKTVVSYSVRFTP